MMKEYHAALRQKIEERTRRVDLGYRIDGEVSECWVWEHRTSRNGYGRVSVRGKERAAHRVSFMLWGGAVFEEDRLDHLCRNRDCVNPDHLEPVTVRENTRRGVRARIEQGSSSANGKANGAPNEAENGDDLSDIPF